MGHSMKTWIRRFNQERRDLGPLRLWEIKEFISNLLNRSDAIYGYRLLWRVRPDFTKLVLLEHSSAVLQTTDEAKTAWSAVEAAGLPHALGQKDWDTLIAFRQLIESTSTTARILDAGAELSSVILLWLYLYGYRNLVGNNLAFSGRFRRGAIHYEAGDITRTPYGDEEFDAITCLSVIEHQVPVDPFLKEMARIMKPGAHLVVSTDYWDPKIPTDDVCERYYKSTTERYEVYNWVVFCQSEIDEIISKAQGHGLQLTSSFDKRCTEPTVVYLGKRYTFLCMTFKKA